MGETESLAERLKEHYTQYRDKVEEYDFAEIPDLSARRREEKRLLDEYSDVHGRLPELNRIKS